MKKKVPHNRMTLKHTRTLLLAQALLLHGVSSALASSETLNQYLDMDLAQLMQVTITSVAKKPQALADTAAAVFVITQEDIRRSGVTSIPQALAMAPGLQVSRMSASKWSIAARGFGGYTSNKLLVLMDGRSLYTPAYSGTFWDAQNTLLEDVDRIEIIRGPGGTIWGANAVNGVINIITRKAKDTEGTLVRASAGVGERFGAAVRQGGKLGESTSGRLYLMTSDVDSNTLRQNTFSNGDDNANDDWRDLQTGFRLDGTVSKDDKWTLQGDLYKIDGNQIVFPFWLDSPPFLTADSGDYTASGANVIGSWQHRFQNDNVFTLKSYYDNNSRTESYYEDTFNIFDLDIQYEMALGSWNNLTTGLGYRHVDGDFVDNFQVSLPDQTQNLYSAFFQDQFTLVDRLLWLTLGTKYEHNDFTGNEWQPSARLLWKPAEEQSVWAAVARAVRTPSMVERTGRVTLAVLPTQIGAVRSSLRGYPSFTSETLIAYEAGYRWQARRTLSFDLAAYYNDYDELYAAVRSTNPFDPDIHLENVQHGTGHGLEFATNWQARSWMSLNFTYSWQKLDLEFDDPSIKTGALSITPVSSSPKHQASVRTAFDFAENWQSNLWLRYVDSFDGRDTTNSQSVITVPSQFIFDANLIWKPRKNLEIMLAGQNLLSSGRLQAVAELITPPTEIERVIYAKVTWSF